MDRCNALSQVTQVIQKPKSLFHPTKTVGLPSVSRSSGRSRISRWIINGPRVGRALVVLKQANHGKRGWSEAVGSHSLLLRHEIVILQVAGHFN